MSRLLRLAAITAAIHTCLAPTPASADDCTSNALSDPFECRELIIEYDGSFDAGAFHAHYGTISVYELPRLSLLLVRAPDIATREWIEDQGFTGIRRLDTNSRLLSPECLQRTMGVIELTAELDALALQIDIEVLGTGTARADGVLVAIADSGFDLAHSVFAGVPVIGGVDLVDGDLLPSEEANGIDDDIDGFIDPGFGHGTATASLVAVVAPGVSLLPLRITDDECRTTAMRVATSIYIAVESGARVLNLSIGMNNAHGSIQRALSHADDVGMLVVAPGGNAGIRSVDFPASESRTLAVTATDALGIKSTFASYGSSIDIAAPGSDVLAAYPGDLYARYDGSSFASAIVSGVAALGFAAGPCIDGDEMFDRLRASARPIDHLAGNLPYQGDLGDGMVDAAALLGANQVVTSPPPLLATRLADGHVAFHWSSSPELPESFTVARVDDPRQLPLMDQPGCRACSAPPEEVCTARGLTLSCVTPNPVLLTSGRVVFLHPLAFCGNGGNVAP